MCGSPYLFLDHSDVEVVQSKTESSCASESRNSRERDSNQSSDHFRGETTCPETNCCAAQTDTWATSPKTLSIADRGQGDHCPHAANMSNVFGEYLSSGQNCKCQAIRLVSCELHILLIRSHSAQTPLHPKQISQQQPCRCKLCMTRRPHQ